MPLISVVSPCYNEEDNVDLLVKRLNQVCSSIKDWDYEIVLVDDGSTDKTREMLRRHAEDDLHVRAVLLSRNHGQQLALSAGLRVAQGDIILILDADMQDPPELLPEMMSRIEAGAEVVYGQRNRREGETVFKKTTSKLFYRLLNSLTDVDIPRDTGDFRLMTRRALDVMNSMPERNRFTRGMISWVGFKQEAFLYDRDPRIAGETKWDAGSLAKLAIDAITSFSIRPLKIASLLGLSFAALGGLGLIYMLYSVIAGVAVPGWASLISVILICSSAQLLVLGVIGEYLGRLYLEAKNRPLFVIEDIVGEPRIKAPSENVVGDMVANLEARLNESVSMTMSEKVRRAS